MTCLRKGCMLKFKSNSTATPDGSTQQLESDVWYDSELIATKVCSLIGCKWNAMFENHVVASVDRLWSSFDFRFSELFFFVNNHLQCKWQTIHNLISKICPKFQVLCTQFFKVNELLCEQWEKIVWSENISTPMSPIYVECNKMYRPKIWVQEFWYCVPGLDIQLELSYIDNPASNNV